MYCSPEVIEQLQGSQTSPFSTSLPAAVGKAQEELMFPQVLYTDTLIQSH